MSITIINNCVGNMSYYCLFQYLEKRFKTKVIRLVVSFIHNANLVSNVFFKFHVLQTHCLI